MSQLTNLKKLVGMEYFMNIPKENTWFDGYKNKKPQANNNRIVNLNFIAGKSSQTFKTELQ